MYIFLYVFSFLKDKLKNNVKIDSNIVCHVIVTMKTRLQIRNYNFELLMAIFQHWCKEHQCVELYEAGGEYPVCDVDFRNHMKDVSNAQEFLEQLWKGFTEKGWGWSASKTMSFDRDQLSKYVLEMWEIKDVIITLSNMYIHI